jgi:hypothetical protein
MGAARPLEEQERLDPMNARMANKMGGSSEKRGAVGVERSNRRSGLCGLHGDPP